jgi:hypothetical protein
MAIRAATSTIDKEQLETKSKCWAPNWNTHVSRLPAPRLHPPRNLAPSVPGVRLQTNRPENEVANEKRTKMEHECRVQRQRYGYNDSIREKTPNYWKTVKLFHVPWMHIYYEHARHCRRLELTGQRIDRYKLTKLKGKNPLPPCPL